LVSVSRARAPRSVTLSADDQSTGVVPRNASIRCGAKPVWSWKFSVTL
jgi:hypothetical protein